VPASHVVTDRAHPRMAALVSPLSHRDVAQLSVRLAAHVPREATPAPESRLAAVAAVLRVVQEPEVLFIKRAEAAHDPWSGHIAFPGGRFEPADASLEATAVRETREELDLDLRLGRVLGRLDDLAPRSRALPPVIVRPFVAVVPADVVLSPSDEVAASFWVPIRVLRDPAAKAEHVLESHGVRARFPAYRVDEHVVWGLTERILRQLLTLIDDRP
jgi:8-oxo-dGTP pyrophosphatase MutT (NUDIX family)